MSQVPIHILLVEDDEDDYLLTVDLMDEIEEVELEVTWSPSFEDGIAKLQSSAVDLCLVDFRIGGRSGLDFMDETKRLGLTLPIVFLTGMGDRQTDIAAMQAGAYDFLQKSELTAATLDRAIRYSISQAESRRALIEQTSLLQATLDNTGAAIAAIDATGRMAAWNDRFIALMKQLAERHGKGESRLTDESILQNVHLDTWLPVFSRSWDEFDTGDGQVLSIRRNDTPDGGSVVVCHDITQHKRAEQALREAMWQAESASAAKSAFLANVSHELRTPLNAIIGFADLMIGKVQGPVGCAEYESYIAFIKESGDTLLQIINATLDLARIEAGEYPLDQHDLDIVDAISSALRQIAGAAKEKGIQFDVNVASEALCVSVDETAIGKILAQILSNAVKFSHNDGLVEIRASLSGDSLDLQIRDHGIGMDPKEVECAISQFSQVDARLTRKYEGVGLGLPLARSLVELHGGRLEISSTPDKGTTLTITLPGAFVRTQAEDTGRQDSKALLA